MEGTLWSLLERESRVEHVTPIHFLREVSTVATDHHPHGSHPKKARRYRGGRVPGTDSYHRSE